MKRFTWITLGAGVFLAVVVSPFASNWLDGLERVAADTGFLARGEGEPLVRSPIPDYAFPGVAGGRLATAAAGAVGTVLTFGVAYALAAVLRKRRKQ